MSMNNLVGICRRLTLSPKARGLFMPLWQRIPPSPGTTQPLLLCPCSKKIRPIRTSLVFKMMEYASMHRMTTPSSQRIRNGSSSSTATKTRRCTRVTALLRSSVVQNRCLSLSRISSALSSVAEHPLTRSSVQVLLLKGKLYRPTRHRPSLLRRKEDGTDARAEQYPALPVQSESYMVRHHGCSNASDQNGHIFPAGRSTLPVED